MGFISKKEAEALKRARRPVYVFFVDRAVGQVELGPTQDFEPRDGYHLCDEEEARRLARNLLDPDGGLIAARGYSSTTGEEIRRLGAM